MLGSCFGFNRNRNDECDRDDECDGDLRGSADFRFLVLPKLDEQKSSEEYAKEIKKLNLQYHFDIHEVAICSANGIGDCIASEDNKLQLVYVQTNEYSDISDRCKFIRLEFLFEDRLTSMFINKIAGPMCAQNGCLRVGIKKFYNNTNKGQDISFGQWFKKIINEKDNSYYFHVEGDIESKIYSDEDGHKHYICSSSKVGLHQPIILSTSCDANKFRLIHI